MKSERLSISHHLYYQLWIPFIRIDNLGVLQSCLHFNPLILNK